MYEWENEINKNSIANRINSLRAEIKRVSNTTMRGNFENQDDRKYWQNKLTKMNSELLVLENM